MFFKYKGGGILKTYHIRVGVRAVIIENEAILLNEFNHGLYYNLPGGGAEPGESLQETVRREVNEETGLDIDVGELLYVLEYEPTRNHQCYGETHKVSVVFLCTRKPSSTISPPRIPDDDPCNPHHHHTGSQWIKIRDLSTIECVPYIDDLLIRFLETGRFEPQFLEEPLHPERIRDNKNTSKEREEGRTSSCHVPR